MIIKEYDGIMPKIDESVFIAENATVIGDVVLGKDVSVWYGAVLRGDMTPIYVGEGSNVQDNATLHGGKGYNTVVGKNVTIGHNAIVHGATVEDNVMIGMHATVLNGAKIGRNSIVAAGALVKENAVIPENSLVVGVPGKVIRTIDEEQAKGNLINAEHYLELANKHK